MNREKKLSELTRKNESGVKKIIPLKFNFQPVKVFLIFFLNERSQGITLFRRFKNHPESQAGFGLLKLVEGGCHLELWLRKMIKYD